MTPAGGSAVSVPVKLTVFDFDLPKEVHFATQMNVDVRMGHRARHRPFLRGPAWGRGALDGCSTAETASTPRKQALRRKGRPFGARLACMRSTICPSALPVSPSSAAALHWPLAG